MRGSCSSSIFSLPIWKDMLELQSIIHSKFTFFYNWRAAIRAKARSDAIDRQIEEDARGLRRDCNVLILGSRESGKSTIVKQMKIIHQNGFDTEELMAFRPAIYRNTLDSAQALILAMRKLNLDYMDPMNQANARRILDYHVESSPSFIFSPDIVRAIHKICQDEIMSQVMDHSSEFYLMDNAAYFFANIERIGTPDYCPTTSDILRVRAMTMGIMQMWFMMGQLRIHIIDVGNQRPERKKWIHCFVPITSIIFCAALSEYDQLLPNTSQNRMAESLLLFESIVNSHWFLRTSILLFLTKIDLFKIKVQKVPLERYFPEYSGGADINKAAKYILWRFMQMNRARLSVYPHLTEATDTTAVRLMFAAVKETILQNALKDSGIL